MFTIMMIDIFWLYMCYTERKLPNCTFLLICDTMSIFTCFTWLHFSSVYQLWRGAIHPNSNLHLICGAAWNEQRISKVCVYISTSSVFGSLIVHVETVRLQNCRFFIHCIFLDSCEVCVCIASEKPIICIFPPLVLGWNSAKENKN